MMPEPAPLLAPPAISPVRFRRIAQLIHSRTGIRMPDSKIHLIEGRLMRKAREVGMANIDAYCDRVLNARPDDPLLTEFFNAVTTNKTDFFREPVHFDYLTTQLLPARHAAGQATLRCWSAAASSGMEAYTLAMVLAEAVQAGLLRDFEILATDLDTRVLAEARRGVYRHADLAAVPATLRAAWFANARDRRRREARVIPALRSKVAFAQLNLMEAQYGLGDPLDVIFCRNVLIYFDKDTQFRVISRLCEVLRPGGHLFLGHSETIHGLDLPLQAVGSTVFRKKG
ncbi:MAG TPA: CheR family methyltransferase [Novosphingobium sp.]|nr:CheR family methyltransferase [Novosphingobium sp.]HZV10496.1 CheR family methyltransferase [Novosphingobium sp.]